MIRIGEFSKLAHISIKALHHYGRLGLLRPAHVDRFSGYRYYSLEQLVTVNRILALKDLGFSLEQIAQLLTEDIPVAELRGMLRLKQMELHTMLQEESSRLKRVEMRLRNLEHSGTQRLAEIALKQVPAQTALVASRMLSSPEESLGRQQELINMLSGRLQRSGLQAQSPWFALSPSPDDAPEGLGSSQMVKIGVGVCSGKKLREGDFGGDTIQLVHLPEEERMASVVHTGPLEDLSQVYTDLYGWVQGHGMRFTDACREIFLPQDDLEAAPNLEQDQLLVELQCPVEKTPVPISIRPPDTQEEFIMEPKFVTLESFKAVGLPFVGSMFPGAPNDIPQLWGVFNRRSAEIPNKVDKAAYGMCFSEYGDPEEFEYVACFEVTDTADVPEGMVVRSLPGGRFAVFEHHGKLDKLRETYDYIYKTWLPQSGEKTRDMFEMEVYDEKFIPDSDESVFYIYVALE